jgi:hypothetical protein
MRLNRLVLSWSGAQVKGNAVTVLHYDGTEDAAPPVAAVFAALDEIKLSIPTGVTITVPNSGEVIEDTTGELVSVWTGTGGGSKVMTGNSAAAAGAGGVITWNTGAIVNGRHLRGRTFIVPFGNDNYDVDGTLSANAVSRLNAFATALIASGGLGVWHRPTTPGGSDGTSSSVLSSRVRDHVAFLSSRRD